MVNNVPGVTCVVSHTQIWNLNPGILIFSPGLFLLHCSFTWVDVMTVLFKTYKLLGWICVLSVCLMPVQRMVPVWEQDSPSYCVDLVDTTLLL